MTEKSKIESVATVLGGVAAAIFIIGVILHIRKQGITGAVANVAGSTTASAGGAATGSLTNSGLILLPTASSGSASTGSDTSGNSSGCNNCGNPFYGSLAMSYQAG